MVNGELYERYSIGVLVENVVNGNPVVKVWPIERVPMIQPGEMETSYFDKIAGASYQHKGVDASGKHYRNDISTDVAISAKYLSQSRNQVSIPLMRKNERVMIYRLKGSNEFYWQPLGTDNRLGERDHHVEMFAATKEGEQKGFEGSPEQAYTKTMSPANGEVSIVTSKANGEPASYVVQINTKQGAVVVQDDLGNIIQISSVEKRITLRNGDDTFIDMNKENLSIQALGNCDIKIGGNLNVEVGGNETYKIGGNEERGISGSATRNVSGSTEFTCPDVSQTSSQMTVQCPTNDFIGMVNVGGLSTTGNGGSGDATLSGGMKAQKDVVAGSISLQGHTHYEQGDGRPTSAPN